MAQREENQYKFYIIKCAPPFGSLWTLLHCLLGSVTLGNAACAAWQAERPAESTGRVWKTEDALVKTVVSVGKADASRFIKDFAPEARMMGLSLHLITNGGIGQGMEGLGAPARFILPRF